MQKVYFSNGGFVIHKIPYNGGNLSAWFDSKNNLVDIEKFDSIGRNNSSGLLKASEYCRKMAASWSKTP